MTVGLPRVVVLDDWSGEALRGPAWVRLRGRVVVRRLARHVPDEAVLAGLLRDAAVVVAMRERTPIGASLLDRLPSLRLIVTTGRANAAIDLAAARARGVLVCATDVDNGDAAELTWALILAAARHLPAEHERLRRGAWTGGLGMSLGGRRLGVIGLGRLGARVARVGLAFGMEVVAWSHNLTAERCSEVGVEPAPTLDALLASSDVVTIHQRLSDRTRGLIGERELALMRPTSLLVNTSRGPIVDEAALLRALDAGRPGAAALDVFTTEPLPRDHPLRRHPRVLATPHLGYVADASWAGWYGEVVEDIEAWLDGRPIRVLGGS